MEIWASAAEPKVATVPLVGQVAAGNPISAIPGEVEETYRFPRDFVGRGDPLFLVRVRGDSMTDAGIHDRDFVVVRRQPDAEIGDLVVVRPGGERRALSVDHPPCRASMRRPVAGAKVVRPRVAAGAPP